MLDFLYCGALGFSIRDDSSSHTPYRKMKQIQTGQFVGVKNLAGSNLSGRPLILHVISNVQLPPATQQEDV